MSKKIATLTGSPINNTIIDKPFAFTAGENNIAGNNYLLERQS